MNALSLRKRADEVEVVEAVGLRIALPGVNLLPPEIELRRRFRKVQAGLGGAVLASVVVVAALCVAASGSVSDAQAQVDASTAHHAVLQSQKVKYSDVTAVYAKAASAQAMLGQAMADEVRWSRLLNDLSLTVPDNVWVKQVTFHEAAATGSPATTTATATDAVGTASFTGVGFSHDDVAVWLESLAAQKGYADPYFQSSTEALLGPRKVVGFTSTTTVTRAALSGRYSKVGG